MRRFDTEIVTQQFEDRLIGGGVAVRPDARFIDANVAFPATFGEFKAQPALSRSGLAGDADHASVAIRRVGQFLLKCLELFDAVDQRAEPLLASEHHAGPRIAQTQQAQDFDRLREPAHHA